MEQIIIGIRADGNAQIGMGHLMRCLSVAIALKEHNVNVIFITNNEQSKAFVEEKGFVSVQFLGQHASMEEETVETISILKEYGVDLLLVDSYSATENYLAQLKKFVPVFYMDDLGRMNLPVSGLINYNIYGQDMGYEQYYPESVELLLGSKYAPVKKEFLETAYEVHDKVTNILITMGGSDSLNIAGQLGERLLQVLPQDVKITLICGRFSPHLTKVRAFAMTDSRIHVLTDVNDMWNKMANCDLAIAAAGSTMYELCTMGVPTICCYYVENQRRIAEGFAAQTSMVNAGDFSKDSEIVLGAIVKEVERLLSNAAFRKKLSEEMRNISDGKGAERIARKLCDYIENIQKF